MLKGSFEGLYTFKEVAEIYNLTEGFLRKRAQLAKLVEGRDIKKFGNVWVITEQAMIKYFGSDKLNQYRSNYSSNDISKNKTKKRTTRKVSKKDENICLNGKEEVIVDSWCDDIKGKEIKKFTF